MPPPQPSGMLLILTPWPSLPEQEAGPESASNLGNWHTDRAGLSELGHPRLKVMVYLTPNTSTAGALRVVAGSHLASLHGSLVGAQTEWKHGLDTKERFGMEPERRPHSLLDGG